MTMNRHDFCKELQTEMKNRADKTISMADAGAFIDSFCAVIADALAKGNEVGFTGFGKFTSTIRPEHEGVNPSTGEKIMIAETRAPKFKPGKNLKEIVNA